jgi:hypothetical protein
MAACGSSVGRGAVLYQQHNYIEAAETFERTQSRLALMEPGDRARYGLYRGLTFMALGDLRNAERWLDYAELQQRAQPAILAQNERELLHRGRLELSQRVRDAWPKPERGSTQGLAVRTSPPDESQTAQKQ